MNYLIKGIVYASDALIPIIVIFIVIIVIDFIRNERESLIDPQDLMTITKRLLKPQAYISYLKKSSLSEDSLVV